MLGNENSSEECLSRFWYTPDREISIHLFRYPPGLLECPAHSHGEFSITISLESELSFWVSGQKETITPGDVFIIQPGELHAGIYTVDPAPLGLTISVAERALKRLLAEMGADLKLDDIEIRIARLVQDHRFPYLAQEMTYEIESRAPGRDAVLRSLLTQFLISLLRFCLQPVTANARQELARQLPAWEMVRAIECMNQCRKSSFSLARLCSEIGTSQSRFVQLFRNSANTSPLAFYNRILVNKAKRLLSHSGLSVKEVAYTLEFQNESHFCTLFRSVAGTTPSQFRISGRDRS